MKTTPVDIRGLPFIQNVLGAVMLMVFALLALYGAWHFVRDRNHGSEIDALRQVMETQNEQMEMQRAQLAYLVCLREQRALEVAGQPPSRTCVVPASLGGGDDAVR